MKLTYDPKVNIGYIAFRERTEQVQTLHISEELNIDLSPDGIIYGIELLNANEQLVSGTIRKLMSKIQPLANRQNLICRCDHSAKVKASWMN